MHYTYIHRRESDNAIFYVGKGQRKRAWTSRGRNKHWHAVKAKHGCKVEVVAPWPTDAEACAHEVFLIACFKAMGEPLVNQTDGGDGVSGFVPSDVARARMSVAQLEIQNRPHIKAQRASEMKLRHKDNAFKTQLSASISQANKDYKAKPIMCIENGMVFASSHDAARWLRENGWPKAVNHPMIEYANGKRKSAYGHTWKFIEKEMA